MQNPHLFIELVELFILEFTSMITSYCAYVVVLCILQSSCKLLECRKGITFLFQEESPSEPRKIIHNNNSIVISTRAHGS